MARQLCISPTFQEFGPGSAFTPVSKRCAVSGGLSRFGVAIRFVLEPLSDGNLQEAHSLEPYSYRRATTGSTRIARRAGGYDASEATTKNEIETTTK